MSGVRRGGFSNCYRFAEAAARFGVCSKSWVAWVEASPVLQAGVFFHRQEWWIHESAIEEMLSLCPGWGEFKRRSRGGKVLGERASARSFSVRVLAEPVSARTEGEARRKIDAAALASVDAGSGVACG